MLIFMLQTLNFIIDNAIEEDKSLNDITSDLTISNDDISHFVINAREYLIFCGAEVVEGVFKKLLQSEKFKNCKINYSLLKKDGDRVFANEDILKGSGNSKLILAAERIILNLIQHLSSISTQTNEFVCKLNNPKIKILDTRKTLPLYRELQKYAVKCGGGANHRFNLADLILIKDNHISANGDIDSVFKKIDKYHTHKIEIECDNFFQVKQSLIHNPDIIMLDNMSFDELNKSIFVIKDYSSNILIEVSGGINLQTIDQYRNLPIDFISVGSITNNIKNVDIGLDFFK